jgi:peptide/nickel transport system permease protein
MSSPIESRSLPGPISDRHVEAVRELLGDRKALLSLIVLGTFVLMAIGAPVVAPHDPTELNFGETFAGPSLEHPLGTDSFGRDILSRVIFGARVSMLVGFGSVAGSVTLGVPAGLVAGYYSDSWAESVIMRLVDAMLAFPSIVFALALISVIGAGVRNIIIATAIANVPVFARLVHGEVLSIKEKEYIDCAKAAGSSDRRILLQYLLPNAAASIIVQATMVFVFAVIGEAGLSFLGAGVSPPTPSFGLMLLEAKNYLNQSFWLVAAPGGAIILAVLSLNFLGDALRDVLDTRDQTTSRY